MIDVHTSSNSSVFKRLFLESRCAGFTYSGRRNLFHWPSIIHASIALTMLEPHADPSQTTPLLASSELPGYSTIEPKLSLVIPKHHAPAPVLMASLDGFASVVDEDPGYDADISRASTACTLSPDGTGYCRYCLEQGIDHKMQGHHQQALWRRSVNDQGIVGLLVWGQMCLLAILVPLFLFIVLRVYLGAYFRT
ncbi:hypothetical protein HD806DRAFT_537707 [Xylariaceae sp. AK1471]|nr:hypothetical protein HD806DRAFT_537707 [Xylariaceae sp. AK1471]